jgi:hypothetical protein
MASFSQPNKYVHKTPNRSPKKKSPLRPSPSAQRTQPIVCPPFNPVKHHQSIETSLQITPTPPPWRKLQNRRQTIPKTPHIRIGVHALAPAEVRAVDQTPVAVLAGLRAEGDGGRGVALGFGAGRVGLARPFAAGEPGWGARRAKGWVLAGAVEAGYGCAHFRLGWVWVWV